MGSVHRAESFPGVQGMLAQALVHYLAVGPSLAQRHQNTLDGCKWTIFSQVPHHGSLVDLQASQQPAGLQSRSHPPTSKPPATAPAVG